VLTFGAPHVLKAIQLLHKESYVSRDSFCKALHIGEGAVKTLILHLKEEGMVDSVRSGTFLTKKGQKFTNEFFKVMPAECLVPKSTITGGKNSYAVLLRNFANEIKSGLEQRDAAILYGATGAITILFRKNEFVFPGEEVDCLRSDQKTKQILLEDLQPRNGDVIIIVTSQNPFVSEIAAKNSALYTLSG
jgi:biotin operon repressor